ncbi:MAG: pantetheine-phosphate adenylyltransferase [Actinomycetales bacterium]
MTPTSRDDAPDQLPTALTPVAMSGRRCVCPGSYDPITYGHVDVVVRAAELFDEVIVAVVHNPSKSGTFAVPERIELIRDSLPGELLDSGVVRIDDVPGGLLVDYCLRVGARSVVKGIRGGTDFAYELPMARMNRQLTGLETIFLPGDPTLEHVSSSLIREVVIHGGDVTGMVPESVRARLEDRLR